MKKTAILTMTLSVLIVTFCLNCYADDLNAQISALEQKAGRIQNQINQAQQQNDLAMDQQIKSLGASVDSLVKQRVQLDAYIGKLEGQIDELKKNAQADLSRQVKSYTEELGSVKAQLSSILAKKSAQGSQPATNPDTAAQSSTTPVPTAPPSN